MSSGPAAPPRPRRPPTRARRARRRRRWALALAALALGGGWIAVDGRLGGAVRELTLPLRHEDVIRQQARLKRLDPALLAAMIYVESRFRDRTSPAGAKGLMQILPGTARFIARRSGGTAFELRDLATPQVNIAYGAFYLRYLLDHYDGGLTLAVAAYNGGLANVDRWREQARRRGQRLTPREMPFPETRAYVERVLSARGHYRRHYGRELGLVRRRRGP